MGRTCIFCGDPVDSAEHLWPEWVLKLLPAKKISGSIGRHKNLQFDREFKIRCVCQERCNGGWMSRLETVSQPLLSKMLLDQSTFLDRAQQRTIAAWAIKTAMVLNAAVRGKRGERTNYYSASECSRLRESLDIPTRTFVWLGRFLGSNLGAWSSGLLTHYPDDPGRYRVQVSTILMGSLVMQVLSGRVPDKHLNANVQIGCAIGPWDEILIGIWPPVSRPLYWPPALAFNQSGTIVDIQTLPARWRLGKERPFGVSGPDWAR